MPEHAARNFAQTATSRHHRHAGEIKVTAQEATKIMELSCVSASKGAIDFNLKLMDIAQDNVNAAFDFARQLARVTSPSEFFELSTAQVRKQVERFTEQTRDITQLAQKVTTEASQPLSGGGKTFSS